MKNGGVFGEWPIRSKNTRTAKNAIIPKNEKRWGFWGMAELAKKQPNHRKCHFPKNEKRWDFGGMAGLADGYVVQTLHATSLHKRRQWQKNTRIAKNAIIPKKNEKRRGGVIGPGSKKTNTPP
jgi:hypothetical protein